MRILVIGSGGREHAIVWKIAKSPLVEKIYCNPGNAGISQYAECVDVPNEVFSTMRDFCIEKKIDFTIVGPEQPLVDGIIDSFAENGLLAFGPSAEAAKLEGSKIFAKEFMKHHNIPTAQFEVFNNSAAAKEYIKSSNGPWVVKADGLAAGKGVILCQTEDEAILAAHDMLDKELFGKAGKRILIEEFLKGEEGSFIVISDGTNVIPMATSQDHKAAFNGNKGPNTGGMGAYSPATLLEGEMKIKIMNKIIIPTINGMKAEGRPYKGVLYAGLMIVDNEPFVLEYNVRFGDPETQPILSRMKSDIMPLLLGSAKGDISNLNIKWRDDTAILVVMASAGYPGKYIKGKRISGLNNFDDDENIVVFHAGTKIKNGTFITSGGRVLGVTALAANLSTAREKVYQAVKGINFEDAHYRTDIGEKALKL